MKSASSIWRRTPVFLTILLTVFVIIAPPAARAEVPPRFYWKTLTGANAIPVFGIFVDGNANPLDPTHAVSANASIDGELAIAGYAKTFSLFDRSAMLALLVPMGSLTSEVTVGGLTTRESSGGFGDPIIEFGINLIGPKAIKNIPDLMRYEPGFSLDAIVDIAIPIGEYDNSQTLNLGQNRWYGRVGAPIVWQFGPWVPGQRTTLELLPSVWFFGDNTDFVGQTLKSDPTFELDMHFTRDFTANAWGSLDAVYTDSGDSTINGVTSSGSRSTSAGFTIGYQVTDEAQLTFGYKTSIGGDSSTDLDVNTFMISFVIGWHPLLEGAKRLMESK